ncbi:MAG: BatA domain-containing protein [Phycisphaeraceae bacterium]
MPLSAVLASLVFAAPVWALALPAALLPLLAHLLTRWRARVVSFPPARLVADVAARTRRLDRPRQRALLALRVAALALIVAAFMQPRWRPAAEAGEAANGRTLIIVLDRSASTQRAAGGALLFDEAKRRALAALETLEPGRARAGVVLLDAAPPPLLPELTPAPAALAQRIARLEPTHERADAAGALAEVQRLIDAAPDGPADVRVLLFTDVQRTAWPAAARQRLAQLGATLTDVGGHAPNVAAHDVRVAPASPMVATPATVTARVANHGDEPADVTLRLLLHPRGEEVAHQRVRVPAFDAAAVRFDAVFDRPGRHGVEVALAPGRVDALPADDAAGVVVDVRAWQRVSLITAADAGDARTAAYHLTRALAPTGQRDDHGRGIDVVGREHAADPDAVVVIVEAGSLDGDTLAALARRLREPGAAGLLWIADDAAAAASIQQLADEHATTLPATPATAATSAIARAGNDDERPVRLGEVAFDRPPFDALPGGGRSALVEMRFPQVADLPAPREAVRARLRDGRPLLVVGPARDDAGTLLSGGHVAIWTAALTLLAGDPLLVPLLHELVRELADVGEAGATLHPGDAIDAGEGAAALLDPAGTAVNARTAARLALPGRYRDGDGEPAVWVNVDPAESDLRRAPALGATRDAIAGPTFVLHVEAIELWPAILVVAMLALIVEPVLARRGAGAGHDARHVAGAGEVDDVV